MDLSIESLLTLLHEVNEENVDPFIRMVCSYDMTVSNRLEGWNRIDCTVVVKLLHMTCEWKSDRVRLPGRASYVALKERIKPTLSKQDAVFIEYYTAVWDYYKKCFTNQDRVPYIMTLDAKR